MNQVVMLVLAAAAFSMAISGCTERTMDQGGQQEQPGSVQQGQPGQEGQPGATATPEAMQEQSQ